MTRIIEKTEISEEATSYEIEIDAGELGIQETLADRYLRYRSLSQAQLFEQLAWDDMSENLV